MTTSEAVSEGRVLMKSVTSPSLPPDPGWDGGGSLPAATSDLSCQEAVEGEDHLQEQAAGVRP